MLARDNNSPSSLNGNSRKTENQRSIFRERAVKHYLEGREEEVLPQLVSPKSFLLLWVVFVLLLGSTLVLGYIVRLPLYATGPAMVVEDGNKEHLTVVAFLPPKYLSGLKRGGDKKLLVQLGPKERRRLQLSSVAPKVMNPREAVERLDLQGAERKAITRPKAVAKSVLKKPPRGLDSSSASKNVYRAEVEVGSRPVISLIPIVGQRLGRGSG